MAGSLLLGALGGLLGVFAVLRKQGLLGDVLSHAALPGIVLSFIFLGEKNLPILILGALVSGMISALLIDKIVASTRIKMDGAMAVVLSWFFGIGILFLSYLKRMENVSPSGINDFIFGQAAGMLQLDVVLIGTVFGLGVLHVLIKWRQIKLMIFDRNYAHVMGVNHRFNEVLLTVIFSFGIVISLQAVGVVLTAALFITPAVTALFLANSLWATVLWSVTFGMIGGVTGAYLSVMYRDVPTGASIVVVLSLIFILVVLFSKKGFLMKMLEGFRYRVRVSYENAVLSCYRMMESGDCPEMTVKKDLVKGGVLVKLVAWRALVKKKLVKFVGGQWVLSKGGLEFGRKLIKKHRLWEVYLANKLSMDAGKVHLEAEDMEHILTDEMVVRLEKMLGNPKVDPHGKQIIS